MAESSTFLQALRAGLAAVSRGEHLLVATSGGPDSTALLAGVATLAPSHDWTVTALHVDHGLRGAESDADRERVRALAGTLDVDVVVRAVAIAAGRGLESRARRARHRALAAVASELGAGRILLGHTADDQAETVLLRLLRGGGRGGLAGMRARRGRLLRPLLAATRADVRRYLTDRGLAAAVDRSNADLAHTRNRVRRLAMPFLAAEFNPRLVPALAALAGRLRDEDDVLAALATERARTLIDARGLAVAVATEPPGLGRRVVRLWLEHGSRRGVGATHVERVLDLATRTDAGAVALPGAFRVVREGDRLVRRRGRRAIVVPFELPVTMPGRVDDPRGTWTLALSAPRERRPDEPLPADAGRAVFDAQALASPLVVRSPRPGDRIHVTGVGTRKLQDVLVDARIPREARTGVPVLVAGGVIVWVAGVMRGSTAAIGPSTRVVIDAELLHRG